MSEGHSRLAASASAQWIRCPGSIAYVEFLKKEGKIPLSETNSAAQLGTACHTILEYSIKRRILPTDIIPSRLAKLTSHILTSYDLGGVDVYWKYIEDMRRYYDVTIAEQKYDLSTRFSVDLGGTADVTQLKKRRKLHIGDYKNGRTIVNVVDNYQLKIYALGAYVKYDEEYKFKKILMSIGQPNAKHADGRIRSDEIKVSELLKWEDQYLRPAIDKIKRGTSELNPGEVQCAWCPARNVCEANAKQQLQIVQLDFKKYPEPRQDLPEIRSLTKEQIGFILDNKARLTSWLSKIEEHALAILGSGERLTHYGLIDKVGNRKFIEDKDLKKILKQYKITSKSLMLESDPKPMTVTQLEVHLAKEKRWPKEKVEAFMKKVTTKPITGKELVKNSDTALSDFEVIEDKPKKRKWRV